MEAFRPAALLNRDSSTGVFCEYWEMFKNTCFEEHLQTVVSEGFTWTFSYNTGSEEDVYSKIKQNKTVPKLSYIKKTCLFMMLFIISFFSFSPLHIRRHFALRNKRWYLWKFWNSLTNERVILNQWKIKLLIHLCCRFSITTWISELGIDVLSSVM